MTLGVRFAIASGPLLLGSLTGARAHVVSVRGSGKDFADSEILTKLQKSLRSLEDAGQLHQSKTKSFVAPGAHPQEVHRSSQHNLFENVSPSILRKENEILRKEVIRLRKENERVQREALKLQQVDFQLHKEDAELRRSLHARRDWRGSRVGQGPASLGNETQTDEESAKAPAATKHDGAIIPLVCVASLLFIITCASCGTMSEGMERLFGFDDEEVLQRMISTRNRGCCMRCCCCCTPTVMLFTVLIVFISVVLGKVLWERGVLQPLVAQMSLYAYLMLVCLAFLLLISCEAWRSMRAVMLIIVDQYGALKTVGRRARTRLGDLIDAGRGHGSPGGGERAPTRSWGFGI